MAVPLSVMPWSSSLGPSRLSRAAEIARSDALQQKTDAPGQMPLQGPWRLDDCGWVANRWCELLPLPVALKQRLMELDNPLVRLELVGDVLARTGITA